MNNLETYPTAIYLDLELNCYDVSCPGQKPPEIVEIGIVAVAAPSWGIVRESDYFVRPERLLSKRCTRLTGITREDLANARSFREVLWAISAEWPGNPTCVAWGNDGDILMQACRSHRIKMPFRRSIDLSRLVQQALLLKNQPGLRVAMEVFGIIPDGRAHMAIADARNLARVHAAIIRRVREGGSQPQLEGDPDDLKQPSWFGTQIAKNLTDFPASQNRRSERVHSDESRGSQDD